MNKLLVAFTLLALSNVTFAASACTTPKDKWLSEAEFKFHLRKQGYLVKTLTIRNGCYRIYGLDQYGKRVEINFEPSTGEPIDSQ